MGIIEKIKKLIFQEKSEKECSTCRSLKSKIQEAKVFKENNNEHIVKKKSGEYREYFNEIRINHTCENEEEKNKIEQDYLKITEN